MEPSRSPGCQVDDDANSWDEGWWCFEEMPLVCPQSGEVFSIGVTDDWAQNCQTSEIFFHIADQKLLVAKPYDIGGSRMIQG